jgi:hypothetical protein
MSTLRRSVLCALSVLLCGNTAIFGAQETATPEPGCFRIRVSLNGNLIDGPDVFTLRTKQSDSVVAKEQGCFRVPRAVLSEKALDVFFRVPGNKIYLSAIAIGFFTDSWDIDLDDKKFNRKSGLPKHASSKDACRVVFHGGEPERGLLQTPCRTPAL